MELNFSKEELREIFLASYHYFYNPGNPHKYSTEFNVMASNLLQRIAVENPNSVMERGIVTILSYFIDAQFIVQCNPFPPNLPPFVNPILNNIIPMPVNWRNNIVVHALGSAAEYFIRMQNQVFIVNVFFTSRDRKVEVSVQHNTVNHDPFVVKFREMDLLSLTDPQNSKAFAIHCMGECAKKFTILVTKAALDNAPSSRRTPP